MAFLKWKNIERDKKINNEFALGMKIIFLNL